MKVFKINNKIVTRIFFFSFIFCFLLMPYVTQADSSWWPLVQCGGPTQDPCTLCDLLELAQRVLHFATQMAFLIVVVFIVYGGFRWIFSMGKEENIRGGQEVITNAIIGLTIILCAWLIVNTVFWFIVQAGVSGDYYNGTWYNIECEETFNASNPVIPESSSPELIIPSSVSVEEQIKAKKNEIEQKYSDVAEYGQWAEESIYCYDYIDKNCVQSFGTAYCSPGMRIKDGFCFSLVSSTEILQSASITNGWLCTFKDEITKQPKGTAYVYCIPSYIH